MKLDLGLPYIVFLAFIFVVLCSTVNTNAAAVGGDDDGDVCCIADQLEWLSFWSEGKLVNVTGVDFPAQAYLNVSVRISYDYKNKLSYQNMTGRITVPGPHMVIDFTTIIVNRHDKGMRYTLDQNGQCTVTPIGPMVRQCVPGTAQKINSGIIGNDHKQLNIYAFKRQGKPFTYEALVDEKTCTPVELTYYQITNPSISHNEKKEGVTKEAPPVIDVRMQWGSALFGDITKGIKDPHVFDIPDPCKQGDNSRLFFKSESKSNKLKEEKESRKLLQVWQKAIQTSGFLL